MRKFSAADYFLPPLSHTSLLYPCVALQTVLLGFYHDSSLFTSPTTCIHTRAHDDRHGVRESAHVGGTQKDRGTIFFGYVWV